MNAISQPEKRHQLIEDGFYVFPNLLPGTTSILPRFFAMATTRPLRKTPHRHQAGNSAAVARSGALQRVVHQIRFVHVKYPCILKSVHILWSRSRSMIFPHHSEMPQMRSHEPDGKAIRSAALAQSANALRSGRNYASL